VFDPLKVTEVKLKHTLALVHGLEGIYTQFKVIYCCPAASSLLLDWIFIVFVDVVAAISMQYLKCALISVSFSSMLHYMISSYL